MICLPVTGSSLSHCQYLDLLFCGVIFQIWMRLKNYITKKKVKILFKILFDCFLFEFFTHYNCTPLLCIADHLLLCFWIPWFRRTLTNAWQFDATLCMMKMCSSTRFDVMLIGVNIRFVKSLLNFHFLLTSRHRVFSWNLRFVQTEHGKKKPIYHRVVHVCHKKNKIMPSEKFKGTYPLIIVQEKRIYDYLRIVTNSLVAYTIIS